MSVFKNNYGDIRAWVPISLGIIIVSCLAIISEILGTNKPEYETITVTSKEERNTGMDCIKFIYISCSQHYEYYINGEKVSERFYRTVEKGKSYRCKKDLLWPNYANCWEINNE